MVGVAGVKLARNFSHSYSWEFRRDPLASRSQSVFFRDLVGDHMRGHTVKRSWLLGR